jgi:hypothetical protein
MQKIDELEEMLKHLSSQIRQMNDKQDGGGGGEVINDRPPHY